MSVLALLAALVLSAGPTVTLDQQTIDASIGQTLTVESEVANAGPAPFSGSVARKLSRRPAS